MAKNKVYIDVIVDDKGTTRQVAVSAKKLGISLDKTTKSAQSADRALKGTAKASSSGTKNFAKMTQGITGGLVPAYATLAASVFAVGAAFRFLQEAGDLRVLEEGQLAYASSTGIALNSLTERIIAATDAQIKFTDAAQAAAIGTAAGLSTNQLEQLGKAAKDVSTVLGRDVTDSFNRLVRGVTKAEPELLDELGIILRLKDAAGDYARELNKNENELTAFERTQAVTNDVLDQAQRKYSAILEVVETNTNQFNRLGKSFDDLINSFKRFTAGFLEPIAGFLADNPFTALGVSLIAFKSIFKSVLVGFGFDFEKAAESVIGSSIKATAAIKTQEKALEQLARSRSLLLAGSVAERQGYLKTIQAETAVYAKQLEIEGKLGIGRLQQGKNISQKNIDRLINNAEKGIGQFSKMGKAFNVAFVDSLKNLTLASDTAANKVVTGWKRVALSAQLSAKKFAAGWISNIAKVKLAFIKLGEFITKWALKVVTGLIVADVILAALPDELVAAAKEYLGFADTVDEETKSIITKITGLNDEFENFIAVQKKLLENQEGILNGTAQGLSNVGNVLSSLPFEETEIALASLNNLVKEFEETGGRGTRVKGFLDDIQSVSRASIGLDPKKSFGAFLDERGGTEIVKFFGTIRDSIRELNLEGSAAARNLLKQLDAINDGQVIDPKKFTEAAKAYLVVADAAEGLGRASEESRRQVKDVFRDLEATTKFTDSLRASKQELDLLNTILADTAKAGSADFKRAKERATELERVRAILVKLDSDAFRIQEARLKIEERGFKAALGATSDQKKRLGNLQAIAKLQVDIVEEQQKIDQLNIAAAERGDELNAAEQRTVDLSVQRTENLRAQIALQQRQLNFASQLADTFAQEFETGLKGTLDDLITGDEKSFSDAGLNFAEGILRGLSGTLSKQLTETATDFLGIGNSDPLVDHVTGMGSVLAGHINGLQEVLTGTATGSATLGVDSGKSRASKIGGNIKTALLGTKAGGQSEEINSDGEITQINSNSGARRAGGVFSPFINALQDIFDPDTPFLSKLGGLFMALPRSLENLFVGLGSSLFGIGEGVEGGGLFGSIGGFIKNFFEAGGMAQGGFRAFASGGIATRPTLGLVGEGKMNEAIIPLPDGKSVPVEMMGSGGGNNNSVSIQINAATGENNITGNQEALTLFGNSVADLVQREIADQTRPGGLLARR